MKYIEVVSNEGKFIALIPVELFRFLEYIDTQRLVQLMQHLAEKETCTFFDHAIITDIISDKEYLVKALPKVRRSKYNLLLVLSSEGYLLGIITSGMIESKIADDVIPTQDKD